MKLLKSLTVAEKREIKKAVQNELERYRIYKAITFEEREANITASYSHMPRSSGISDQTAQVAIHNVHEQEKRQAYCRRIERAVERLPERERFLITERYLKADSDYITDQTVYNHIFDPPIAEGTYSKIRDKAFFKLCLILRLDCGVNLLSI